MFKVTTAKSTPPISLLLYGPPGVGKSTAALKTGAILAMCEPGAWHIEGPKVEIPDLPTLRQFISWVAKEDYPIVAIDSVTIVESWLTSGILTAKKWESLAEGDYGEGYTLMENEWARFVNAQQNATKHLLQAGKSVIWIAHSRIKAVKDPQMIDAYERYEPDVFKRFADKFIAAMDGVLFLRPQVLQKEKKGRTVALASSEREVIMSDNPSCVAKIRDPQHPLVLSITNQFNGE